VTNRHNLYPAGVPQGMGVATRRFAWRCVYAHSFPSMRNTKHTVSRYLFVFAAICAVSGAPTEVGADGALNYEGLADVKVSTLDRAQVRPDVVFSVYTDVMLDDIEVAYRTPDRSERQFPLDDEQKARFHDLLTQTYVSELAALKNLGLVSVPGRDTLLLSIRVQDVTATAQTRSVAEAGRAAMALRAVGEVTLVIELFDSQSGEILARGVDTKAIEGAAMAQDGGLVSRWEDVDKLCARWAATTRMRLESLISGR